MLLPLAGLEPAGAASQPPVLANGTSLLINATRISATGVNARSIAGESGVSAPCVQTQTASQVTQTIAALPRGSFLRFEAFQGGYATSPSGTLDFSGIDRVFTAAAAHQIYLIPVLANGWGQCDDGVRKDLRWFTNGYDAPAAPALATAEVGRVPAVSFLHYVATFAARYASSPALGMYEPIGEPDAASCTGQATQDGCSAPMVCHEGAAAIALRSFYDAVGATIRASDPTHLIEAGFGSNAACGIAGDDLLGVGASAGINVLSFHDYSGAVGLSGANGASSDGAEIARATTLNKPIIDAEVGINASSTDPGCVTPAQRQGELAYKARAQAAAGVSGFVLWNVMTGPLGAGCSMSMAPSDPAIAAVLRTTIHPPPTLRALGAPAPSLRGANLAGQDLSGQSFAGLDLSGADLDGATISGADFTGATLTGVHASGLIGTATLPPDDAIVAGTLLGPGLSLAGDDLSNLTLSGHNLFGADLADTTLRGTVLSGVDLSKSSLEGVTSSGIIGQPLLPAHEALIGGVLVGPGANLARVTLAPGSLAGVDLFGATLTGATLSADSLAGVTSGQITAWGPVTLPAGWQLNAGLLLGPGASLTNQNLSGLSLAGVDLTGATLTGVVAQHLVGCPLLSPRWRCTNGMLLGPGLNLTWARLDHLDLSGLSFAGATLLDAELSNDVLTGTDLSHATLRALVTSSLRGTPILPKGTAVVDGMLVGPTEQLEWRDLSNANLSGLNLTGADLTGARLTGDVLQRTDLRKAILVAVDSSGLTGTPLLPASTTLQDGILVNATAQLAWRDLTGANLAGLVLAGANLTGTNLTHATLTGATLTGATLTGATLTGVAATGITGCPTLPSGWTCMGGALVASTP
jgi:uncharacterized protein YjbI with pentapeptide repeats